jgi:hypothetical protein
VSADVNGKVYAVGTDGLLYSSDGSAAFSQLAASFNPGSGTTYSIKEVSVTIEGSVWLRLTLTKNAKTTHQLAYYRSWLDDIVIAKTPTSGGMYSSICGLDLIFVAFINTLNSKVMTSDMFGLNSILMNKLSSFI